ncbi:hypothetical protein AB4Z22_28810, partial [Paenibacillus sp. TAF58]
MSEPREHSDIPVQSELTSNLNYLKNVFSEFPDLIFRHYSHQNMKACLVFICGLAKEESISFDMLNYLFSQVKQTEDTPIE